MNDSLGDYRIYNIVGPPSFLTVTDSSSLRKIISSHNLPATKIIKKNISKRVVIIDCHQWYINKGLLGCHASHTAEKRSPVLSFNGKSSLRGRRTETTRLLACVWWGRRLGGGGGVTEAPPLSIKMSLTGRYKSDARQTSTRQRTCVSRST